MLISLCTPVMNRAWDLKKCLPSRIKAVNNSPPAEIMILDYNSQDDLAEYVRSVIDAKPFKRKGLFKRKGFITYRKYTGRDYYHLAHAWNLALKSSKGDYIGNLSADVKLHEDFVKFIRTAIEEHGYDWMSIGRQNGIVLCKRQLFMDVGGYDEQFEYYGSEDKDLIRRLKRYKLNRGIIPGQLRNFTYTHHKQKIKNYRGNMTKREMMVMNAAIRQENEKNNVMIANQGKEWGEWT